MFDKHVIVLKILQDLCLKVIGLLRIITVPLLWQIIIIITMHFWTETSDYPVDIGIFSQQNTT
jgi:hypothetical protein